MSDQFPLDQWVDGAKRLVDEMELLNGLRGLLERMPIGLIWLNVDGEIILTSRVFEQMLDYGPGDLRGRTLISLLWAPDEKRTIDAFSRQLEGVNNVFQFVNAYRMRDGRVRTLQWPSWPQDGNAQGGVIGICIFQGEPWDPQVSLPPNVYYDCLHRVHHENREVVNQRISEFVNV